MKIGMVIGIAAVAAGAILTVSGATTGAENLVPRSEYNKYRLVFRRDGDDERRPQLGVGVA